MGVALEKSGIAEELLETHGPALRAISAAGIAISVVVVGAMLAASTGIVGASVITMGMISLPTMLRGATTSGSSAGRSAPRHSRADHPLSIILILMGDIMGVSVGDLYIGAVGAGSHPRGPVCALPRRHLRGGIRGSPPRSRPARSAAFRADAAKRVGLALLPAFGLVVGVLGSIFAGVASPTEAASVGAVGGLVLTVSRGASPWRCSGTSCASPRASRASASSSWWAPTASVSCFAD